MATIQDVENAERNVFNAVGSVTSQGPCSESAPCILTAQGVASQVNLALLPFVASDPDGDACAAAVTALDALASTIIATPPLDESSIAAVDVALSAALTAMRPRDGS